ncbi:hypothetical protein E9993_05220 [Labilibacter sediminis]|nr:hypothetical protein E9993_05220 [Labilibacter sediminis]
MTSFLIYLFESGLCLSLFYLGYVVFFRKETYFNFNRFYLLASLILSVIMPIVPLQFSGDQTEVSSTIQQINSFKNYYEELILITDPDYEVSYPDKQISNNDASIGSVYSSWNVSGIIFYIYIAGLLFFVTRLLFLVYQLFKYIRTNRTIETNGVQLVLVEDNVPSFSFLRWVFLNKNSLKQEEYEQVLAHEKVHVQHKHSVDLLLAQMITLLQWFNPLTWRIQKSMKTCHEYIADRKVIEQGHTLFDYQSLLLSQLISIRSVELVNNFNLLSIKKRIAMMNKSKSGRIAQLKALLVIPILSFAFVFFANCTDENINNSNKQAALKSAQANHLELDVPYAREVKTYDDDFILCTLSMTPESFYFNGVEHDINKVDELIASIVLPEDKEKARKMSVLLEVDSSVKMQKVDQVRQTLRNNDLTKIGFVTKVNSADEKTALFMLMPPKDAMVFEESKIEKSKVKNLFIFQSSDNRDLENVSEELISHIKTLEKYVMVYKYHNETLYSDYLEAVDMVWHTVYSLRRKAAKQDAKDYDELSSQLQKQYRRKYPMTLVSNNVDID